MRKERDSIRSEKDHGCFKSCMSKALIAMSGGVDSSVSAALMKEKGYECIGVTMKLYDNEDAGIAREKSCCSIEDTEDAASVARSLDMPYHVFNFTDDFRCRVMDKFVQSYVNGITPNPCIDCNRYMKFEHLYRRGRELGCDKIVTGHYARVVWNQESGRYELWRAVDDTKDQSYVLYSLTQEQLAHTEFPLGEYPKTKVREIAEQHGFINARKHDSQDICFVPDGHYERFIENYLGKKLPAGNFVDEQGNVLGRHKGIIYYTIGQRKGLGIAAKQPLYVKEIRPESNEVVLSAHNSVFSKVLYADQFNWLSIEAPDAEIRVQAKVRYRQQAQPAVACTLPDGRVEVRFEAPQRAVTKGQAVVLYDQEKVLGGGTIL